MKKKKDLLAVQKNSPMEQAKKLVELQALMKKIKPEIDSLKENLLKTTQELGVLSLKTEKYTISRARRITPEVVNFNLLKKSLDKIKIPYETKEVFADFMSATFRTLIDKGVKLDGLEEKETEYILVRVKEDKHGK